MDPFGIYETLEKMNGDERNGKEVNLGATYEGILGNDSNNKHFHEEGQFWNSYEKIQEQNFVPHYSSSDQMQEVDQGNDANLCQHLNAGPPLQQCPLPTASGPTDASVRKRNSTVGLAPSLPLV